MPMSLTERRKLQLVTQENSTQDGKEPLDSIHTQEGWERGEGDKETPSDKMTADPTAAKLNCTSTAHVPLEHTGHAGATRHRDAAHHGWRSAGT